MCAKFSDALEHPAFTILHSSAEVKRHAIIDGEVLVPEDIVQDAVDEHPSLLNKSNDPRSKHKFNLMSRLFFM